MASLTLEGRTQDVRKWKTIGLWSLQIVTAGLFAMASFGKLTGDPHMVQTFEAIGFGQWFRYLTGSIELISALLLLIPGYAAYGALFLVGTMIGAVLSHLFILGGSPAAALVFLTLSLVILTARRETLLAHVRKET